MLAAAALACILASAGEAAAQRLVFVVRHAERADAGAGGMQSQTDPALSAAGTARAGRLAAMLADAGITAVVATEFKRTQQTAEPIAARLGLDVTVVRAADTDRLVATLKDADARGIVLVVGHSNTVPDIIRALGGPTVTLADDDYSSLFVVVPATGTVTRIRF